MGLASQVLCFWQQPVFREVQSAILQGLAELGAGQGPSITSPPIGANVHHTEMVPGIYNCQEDDGPCDPRPHSGQQLIELGMVQPEVPLEPLSIQPQLLHQPVIFAVLLAGPVSSVPAATAVGWDWWKKRLSNLPLARQHLGNRLALCYYP
ncbi:hypothetical protein AAFF_G00409540 [Aldrovandia affinis]|uniref:Uncharacterized protein n=1 Tax=Aldrovandia affinis TaxID=143900 RepID=A0AAD7SC07_9TELE|nr:hypothetical protein AAFF_G00409540 [Aldrovandia affinis]